METAICLGSTSSVSRCTGPGFPSSISPTAFKGTLPRPSNLTIGVIKGDTRTLDSSSYWENGKENGNYYSILGLYGDPPM